MTFKSICKLLVLGIEMVGRGSERSHSSNIHCSKVYSAGHLFAAVAGFCEFKDIFQVQIICGSFIDRFESVFDVRSPEVRGSRT